MTELPELVELTPQPILSVRRTIPVAQLGPTQQECVKLLQTQLQEQQLEVAGAPFVRYHHFDGQQTEVEIGVPVSQPAQSVGEVQASTRTGGPALTLRHLGPHDATFGASYQRLHAGLTERGREASGPAWEVYDWLDVQSGVRQPTSKWRTQLVQPLKVVPDQLQPTKEQK